MLIKTKILIDFFFVYQQPIRSDMTFSASIIIAYQGMVPEFFLKLFFVCQLMDDIK